MQKKSVQFWEKFLKLVSTGFHETFWLKKTRKATEIHDAGTAVELPSTGTVTTIIVPSRNNPQQPHIVNIYPSGKCECDKNCPGFSVEEICAHVLAACLKKSRLKDFLHWFVTAKRKTGAVNYTRAVTFGMPAGRGRKGEPPPRKRKKTVSTYNSGAKK
mgnify:CR=1 FL=1